MIKLKLLITLVAFWLSASASASLFPSNYDGEFKDALIFLPPGTDWRLLKAQCYQESRLNPLAESPVGAMGLCQFMPGTWREATGANIGVENAWNASSSIVAAAWYMNKLNRFWSAPRPQMDRWMLAQASYNAGAGHLVKAQKLCDGRNYYKEIVKCLPSVTGHHSKETIGYVRNIMTRWWPMMLLD